MYYVYCYIDPLTNEPFYIGKGTKDRAYSHLTETIETTINKRKFYKIESIKKQQSMPIIKFLNFFEDESKAYEYETFLIKLYGRKGYDKNGILTNITIDSNPPNRKGIKLSEEHKNKLRRRKSLDEIEKMKGRTPWNKGLTGVQQAWNKDMKGNYPYLTKHTTESKEKLRQANLGKKKSDKTKQKMSENMKGRTPWNKGKSIPGTRNMKCKFVSPEGNEYYYNSQKDGCKEHNLPTSKVSEVKNGKLSHYKGWKIYAI